MKQPPEELARKLLDASDQILGSGEDVRFDDVAADVGVARATLYYYFSGRDDLVGFLLAEHVRHGAALIDEAGSIEGSTADRLEAVVVALIGFLGEHSGLCSGLLSSMGSSGRMDEVLATNELHVVSPVRGLIQQGIEAGELREADPSDMANALIGGCLMVVLGRSLRGSRLSDEDARSTARSLLEGLRLPE